MDVVHHLDSLSSGQASGWAFSNTEAPLRVQVWADGACIADQPITGERPDVAAGYGDAPGSLSSGFSLEFVLQGAETLSDVTVRLVADQASDEDWSMDIGSGRFITRGGLARLASGPMATVAKSPFPRDVAAAVATLWPGAPVESHRDEDQQIVVAHIAELASQRSAPGLEPIVAYAKYLRQAWGHFQFVTRYFPTVNLDRNPGDKDYFCVPNSPEELFTIAHHLYVLKSYGVEGAFAEFGCFKGYSTAMLSYACRLLGVKMHVFDSFAGLPESESSVYQSGEFAGSLEDVKRHVSEYGAADVVSFHKGFFSDTLATFDMPPLMALWMDVDLESSATDVMTVFDKVDPLSAIFSHECEPPQFVDDQIRATRDPNTVVPPIVDAFERSSVSPRGRYLSGCTGAFWRRDGGLPVLGDAPLRRLLAGV
jgi:O-methyltransferase